MHAEAWEWLTRTLAPYEDQSPEVVEFGSKDLNGSARVLFPTASRYVGIDVYPGAGVDIVCDAADWEPDQQYDVVVCTEVLEHTPRWPEIIATARRALRPGGRLVLTAATDPRAPHSAIRGKWPLRGEFYENVDPRALRDVLEALGFDVDVTIHPRGDVYVVGRVS